MQRSIYVNKMVGDSVEYKVLNLQPTSPVDEMDASHKRALSQTFDCDSHAAKKLKLSDEDQHAIEKENNTLPEKEDNTLPKINCGGYVFCMSDGSRFTRQDVDRVEINDTLLKSECESHLTIATSLSTTYEAGVQSDDDEYFNFHVCEEEYNSDPGTCERSEYFASPLDVKRFPFTYKCNAWSKLSDKQQEVLETVQGRVNLDRAQGRNFTCAIIDGMGGCGKTRIMAHVMNHKPVNTTVFYVTKQNKRVQDFIHSDCLNGEANENVSKPTDLSPKRPHYIKTILQNNGGGRYALTAEKFIYAVGDLNPRSFDPGATVESLRINYGIFRERPNTSSNARHTHKGNIVILLDEYTMHPPPLIHAIAYHTMKVSGRALVLIAGGDVLQCGPVGWSEKIAIDEKHFGSDVREEIVKKMKYEPVEIKMENFQRCKGDWALGACVKRLRRVCGESSSGGRKKVLHLVLARYSVEANINLYNCGSTHSGVPLICKVQPVNPEVLDFDGSGVFDCSTSEKTVQEYLDGVDSEEYDERGVILEPCRPAVAPTYDLLQIVDHFTTLYRKLAELSFKKQGCWRTAMADTVYKSVCHIRDLFPMFIMLKNTTCNMFAEGFLLALYSQVRGRVLDAPVPEGLEEEDKTTECFKEYVWKPHLAKTLRRCIRSLAIEKNDPINRQTLFVGMIYKMTSTINSRCFVNLCNGETVVLTSLVFSKNIPDRLNSVTLRKLDRDVHVNLEIHVGRNKNRMGGFEHKSIMPFVPHVTENIYQMQGNTMPLRAKTFVDLTDVSERNAYVAVSRFQKSQSIEGIIISV